MKFLLEMLSKGQTTNVECGRERDLRVIREKWIVIWKDNYYIDGKISFDANDNEVCASLILNCKNIRRYSLCGIYPWII